MEENQNLIRPELVDGNEERIENNLRPQSLKEYIGQEKVKENTFNLPIQVNGKLRANIDIPMNLPEEEVKEIAHKQVSSYLEGKEIVKEIYVKNKIYNIVIK